MDGDLNNVRLLCPEGLCLKGRLTYAVPFTRAHMRNATYLFWLRDRDVVRTLNLPAYMSTPVSEKTVEDYCQRIFASERDLFLALHDAATQRFIGTLKAANVDFYHGLADIGIMIGEKAYWGRGFASDAIGALARHLFDGLGLPRLTARAMALNPAMIKVFEKLGFRREGVLRAHDRYDGGTCDHVLFGCLKDELRCP